MLKAKLTRFEQSNKQILGELSIGNDIFKTLELPWRDNKKEISCIPTGRYRCIKRYSKKYGYHFEVINVNGRFSILIHAGNYYYHTLGCILIGLEHKDINKDGLKDVIGSTKALKMLYDKYNSGFELEVVYEPRISL